MQDRLRYRAWDKENKKYIYGVENGLQFYSTAGNLRVMTLAEIAESDKYELEQCTGLRNEDDKLIYEGDILCLASETDKDEYVVNWYELNAQLSLDVLNGRGQTDFDIIGSNYLEIIGNVHENPELLEE